MAEPKRSDCIAVLVTAYSSAYIIEISPFPVAVIFWLYCIQSFLIVLFLRATKDKVLAGYSLLCILHISAYVPLIHNDYVIIHLMLWDAALPLSTIMLSYELAMLIYGGWDAMVLAYKRCANAYMRLVSNP